MNSGTAATIANIKSRLALPVIAAPMFLVSGPDLVIAACKAGVIGSFPTMNARSVAQLDEWCARITSELAVFKAAGGTPAPWAANLIVHCTNPRADEDLAVIVKYKSEIVITALGTPARVIEAVHGYGGLVFADVNAVAFARKAADAGADGLVLVAAGAGGHTGAVTPFSFVPAVREFFSGPIVLGGGLVDGAGVRAAEVLGADFGYMGTRFIATEESLASDHYRDMLAKSTEEDIVLTPHFTGVPANYLKASITNMGLDPSQLTAGERNFDSAGLSNQKVKAWRDIWSAGHGVRAIKKTVSVADLVADLKRGYDAARKVG
ncbi:MAG: nitronate monooxygenase [Rhodospirillaceae bacterium]|nr:nitronate monooxygenase [Rhodospirillaceae bacterium]